MPAKGWSIVLETAIGAPAGKSYSARMPLRLRNITWSLLMVCAVSALATCSRSRSDYVVRADMGMLPRTVVTLRPAGRTVRVLAEVARNPRERARGLMFRRSLAAASGMLFVFDRAEEHPFWMKNTYIPLDMIFISNELKVMGVVAQAAPLTEIPRVIEGPSRYVLEVNAGFAARNGIGPGVAVDVQP